MTTPPKARGVCQNPASTKPRAIQKKFSTTTAGVADLAAWMADFQVTRVVMESTGVYWKCVYYPLEGLFDELWLVNAGHVKNVPGRKTDLLTELPGAAFHFSV